MSLSDSIKTMLMTKYGLDNTSLTVISKAIEKNDMKLIEVDGDLYIKNNARNTLQKMDIEVNGGPELTSWIQSLKNIQANKFDGHMDKGTTVSNNVTNGLLLRYMCEKINMLENEVKNPKSTPQTDNKLTETTVPKMVSTSNQAESPETAYQSGLAVRNTCVKLSKRYLCNLYFLDDKKRSYEITPNGYKLLSGDASYRDYPVNMGAMLMFEQNNTLIYYVNSRITITYDDLQNMRNELNRLFS